MAEIPNFVPIQATQTLAPAKEDVHQRAGGAKRSARVLLEAAAAPRGPLSLPVPSPVLCSPSRSWPGACHLSSPGQTHSSGVNLFPSLCVSARLLIGLDKQQENILRSFGSLAQLPRALCLFSQHVPKDLGRPPNTGLMHRPAPHIPPKPSCSSRAPVLEPHPEFSLLPGSRLLPSASDVLWSSPAKTRPVSPREHTPCLPCSSRVCVLSAWGRAQSSPQDF